MREIFFGLLIAVGSFLGGFYLNNEKPQAIRVYEPGPESNHIHFHDTKTVYLTFDGKAFRLEVDGEWHGLTLVHEEYVKKGVQK